MFNAWMSVSGMVLDVKLERQYVFCAISLHGASSLSALGERSWNRYMYVNMWWCDILCFWEKDPRVGYFYMWIPLWNLRIIQCLVSVGKRMLCGVWKLVRLDTQSKAFFIRMLGQASPRSCKIWCSQIKVHRSCAMDQLMLVGPVTHLNSCSTNHDRSKCLEGANKFNAILIITNFTLLGI